QEYKVWRPTIIERSRAEVGVTTTAASALSTVCSFSSTRSMSLFHWNAGTWLSAAITLAPYSCNSSMIFNDGDSRWSPVSGLYATPTTSTVEPHKAFLQRLHR